MILVTQDLATRRWGFRLLEIIESENKYEATQRVLYEDLSYGSPQDAFSIIADIKKAIDLNRVKVGKDEVGLYSYQIYESTGTQVNMGESGWTDTNEVNLHLNKIKDCLKGDVKMAQLPQTKKMAINDKSNVVEMKSNYDGKEYGAESNGVDMVALREQVRLDLLAEMYDNKKLLGESYGEE
jgi:hypothetical protein